MLARRLYVVYIARFRRAAQQVHCSQNLRSTALNIMQSMPPLDRESFSENISLLALRVPKQKCNEMMKKFRGYTLDKPKIRCLVQDGQQEDSKLLLLDEKVQVLTSLSEELQEVVRSEALESCPYELSLGYNYLSTQQVLKKLLPVGVEAPSSFECVGHIAHLNLREEQLPYKFIIGQVLLDKNAQLKTVVNKTGNIESEFRVFPMEVIAGIHSTETEVVQHGTRFKLDFAKVYWNSRLETEHKRLIALFDSEDTVVDIMAGIGPFAVPAAQKGCTVYANDLNPESVHYMRKNVELNRIRKNTHVFNMDGRAFVQLLLASDERHAKSLPTGEAATARGSNEVEIPDTYRPQDKGLLFQHAIMNLPASAVEFLDAFRGAFNADRWKDHPLPTVHVYTFKKGPETDEDVISKVEHYLGGKLEESPVIHLVRDVAPSKLMLCVSFKVPRAVAFWRSTAETDGSILECHHLHEDPQNPSSSPDGVQEFSSLKRQRIEQSEST